MPAGGNGGGWGETPIFCEEVRATESDMLPYQAQQLIAAAGVLVLAPHPDDEVFGCGGALAAHAAAGVPVHVVILTNGALFGDPDTRLGESCIAGQLLGYGEPECWNFPDRGLEYGEPLVTRLVAAITASTADLVYAPSLREIHPDHRQLAMAAVEAVRRVGGGLRLAQYEVGVPLRPNLLLDITPFLDRKRQAMACFVSQLRQQSYDEHILGLNRFRTYTLPVEVASAEAYTLVSAVALRENALLDLVEPEYVFQTRLGFPCSSQDVPLVSVVVRHLSGSGLRLSLDSLALQTYPNIEVLIVDTVPGLPALSGHCGRYMLRQIVTNQRQPVAAAANAGLDEAYGAYGLVLDESESIPPDHIASLVSALRKQSSCRAAYAGGRQREIDHDQASWSVDCDPIRLLCRPVIPLRAVLFDLCLVNNVNDGCRFDELLDSQQDWDFLLQLSLATDFLRVACAAPFPAVPDNAQEAPEPTSLQAMYERWRTRWSTAQLASLLQRACDPPQLAAFRHHEAELQEAIAEQRQISAAREHELAECRRAVEKLRADLHGRDTQIAEMRLQLQDHQRQRAEMLASHSWRMTRLLRCLSAGWQEWRRK